ncbi:hypothetical protein NDU88_001504 [Pleurodeles waltl]|uniref:Uncharacterized protein n=1 Tax=Pleurodeles waltl TaxID=8319 RepID=A0AAV7UUD7_PLEWA|nr:hypothetical protein NDU88_001504 [Pleurodeles waltl]
MRHNLFWRFSSRTLLDSAFKAELTDAIQDYFQFNSGSTDSHAMLWEISKPVSCEDCISKQSVIFKAVCDQLTLLEDKIKNLDTHRLLLSDGGPYYKLRKTYLA